MQGGQGSYPMNGGGMDGGGMNGAPPLNGFNPYMMMQSGMM